MDGGALAPGPLLYLGLGRPELALRAEQPARLLLIGGEPFEEHLVMWWNFVGRDHDDIVAARDAVDGRRRPVRPGPRLPRPGRCRRHRCRPPGSSHAGDSGNILHFRPARLSGFAGAPRGRMRPRSPTSGGVMPRHVRLSTGRRALLVSAVHGAGHRRAGGTGGGRRADRRARATTSPTRSAAATCPPAARSASSG